MVGLTACGICLLAGALIQDTYMAVAFFCMSFGFTQITEAAYWATSIAIGGRLAAAAGGVINTGANVVGFIGGMLVPLIAGSFGWTAAISTGAVFAFVGAGLWLFVRGDRPMAAE